MLKLYANAFRRAIVILKVLWSFEGEMREDIERVMCDFSVVLHVTRYIETNMFDASSLNCLADSVFVFMSSTGISSRSDICMRFFIMFVKYAAKHFFPLAGGPIIVTIHALFSLFCAFILRM